MSIPLQNPDAENAKFVKLLGFRRYFVPQGSASAIHLGHVRTPSRTPAITEKDIDTAIYGGVQTVKSIVSKVAQSGTFESASSGNPQIRALHAGGPIITGLDGNAAPTVYTPNHPYAVGDLVTPTAANGHVYRVTTAGTTDGTEPVWPTISGAVVTDGPVTFAEAGPVQSGSSLAPYTIILENHSYAYGMMIEVNLNAEDSTLPCEINIAPNIGLRGDGYGGGFDGTNETTLKFSEKILSVSSDYKLPASVGDLGGNLVRGVIILPNVPASKWQDVVTSIIIGK